MKLKPAYLKVTTWVDTVAVMAEHYYAEIIFGENQWSRETPKARVTYLLSSRDAIRMNKADDTRLIPLGIKHKPGEESKRFTDRDKMVKAAIKLFEKDPKGFDILFDGETGYIEPKRMLVGPNDIKDKANELYEKWHEAEDGEQHENPKARKLRREWEDLTGMYLQFRQED
jgi:hypothetical protein